MYTCIHKYIYMCPHMHVCFNHDAIETDYTWPYTGPHITSIIFFFMIDL